MFCKKCGASIAVNDLQCRNCSHNTVSLSNHGYAELEAILSGTDIPEPQTDAPKAQTFRTPESMPEQEPLRTYEMPETPPVQDYVPQMEPQRFQQEQMYVSEPEKRRRFPWRIAAIVACLVLVSAGSIGVVRYLHHQENEKDSKVEVAENTDAASSEETQGSETVPAEQPGTETESTGKTYLNVCDYLSETEESRTRQELSVNETDMRQIQDRMYELICRDGAEPDSDLSEDAKVSDTGKWDAADYQALMEKKDKETPTISVKASENQTLAVGGESNSQYYQTDWRFSKTAQLDREEETESDTAGQPEFKLSDPDGKELWFDFVRIQSIDDFAYTVTNEDFEPVGAAYLARVDQNQSDWQSSGSYYLLIYSNLQHQYSFYHIQGESVQLISCVELSENTTENTAFTEAPTETATEAFTEETTTPAEWEAPEQTETSVSSTETPGRVKRRTPTQTETEESANHWEESESEWPGME